MLADAGALGVSFLAGVLSDLSPCVLPLLPLVLGGAAAAHRFGLAALAIGLVVAYVGVGLFVASLGFAVGLDGEVFRDVAAILLALFGIVLLSERLQQRFALSAASLGNAGNALIGRIAPGGLGGQFLLGLLLGMVWSPCVGPTLGAAALLASQGKDLGHVALVMAAFGLGTALPLIAIGALSRQVFARWRGRMLTAGKFGKSALGGFALLLGLAIVLGLDRSVETALVAASPAWLTDLTTRF